MNESFSARVPLDSVLEAVHRFERDGGDGPQPFLIIEVDDHGTLTIGPEPVEVVSIPSTQKD